MQECGPLKAGWGWDGERGVAGISRAALAPQAAIGHIDIERSHIIQVRTDQQHVAQTCINGLPVRVLLRHKMCRSFFKCVHFRQGDLTSGGIQATWNSF